MKKFATFLLISLIAIIALGLFACNNVTDDLVDDTDHTSCIVTFDTQGGTEIESITIDVGSTLTLPEDPTKDGYVFDGWYLDSACATAWNAQVTISSDITLYAKWIKIYTVSFNTSGGNDIAQIKVLDGGFITLPTDPARLGYFFKGWYLDSACKEKFNSKEAVSSDITIYAKWSKDDDYDLAMPEDESYTIIFDTNGGSEIDSITIDVGSTIVLPEEPIKDGYVFDGWYLDSACTTAWNAQVTTSSDITVYAKWIKIFTISFNTRGGNDIAQINVLGGRFITLPIEPVKSGYLFKGWYLDSACKEKFNSKEAVESDMTLYAKWIKDDDYDLYLPDEFAYTIKFDTQGGSEISSTSVGNNGLIIMPVDPTKSGYTFAGWYLDEVYSNPFNSTMAVTEDIVLYAKWNCLHIGAKWIDEVAPTCVKDGALAHYECSVCDKYFDAEYDEIDDIKISARHSYNDDGVCGNCGYFETGLQFELNKDGKSWSIVGIGTFDGADLEIPSINYDTKPVTGISDKAFAGCTTITSITIPSSVETIGKNAFGGCSGLEKISVAKKNKVYHSEGNCLIKTDTNTLVAGCKKSVIPTDGSVKYIGGGAFYGCSGLTEITIPNKIISIYYSAFEGCSGLSSISIPDSVIYIDSNAFAECTALTSIIIPSGVAGVGQAAFANCSNLTNVNWNAVDSDGSSSVIHTIFCGCTALTTVNFGNGVVSIPDYAFYGCASLTTLTMADSVENIGACAFAGCTSLAKVTIPSGIVSIGQSAFYGCTSLVTVDWNVIACASAGSESYPIFNGCTSLTTVNIHKNVILLPANTFRNCSTLNKVNISDLNAWCSITFANNSLNDGYNLYLNDELVKELVIPSGITTVSAYAFLGCSSITKVTIPSGVSKIGDGAFAKCSALKDIDWNATACTLAGTVAEPIFDKCTSLSTVNVGANVVTLPANAFHGCDTLNKVNISDLNAWCAINFYGNPLNEAGNLYLNDELVKELVIPNGITTIPVYAFLGCTSITKVTIPNSVTEIRHYAFSNCTALANIEMGSSVTSIGMGSFAGCMSLTNIIIPESVKSIGQSAFMDCSSLSNVTWNAIECTSAGGVAYPIFRGCDSLNDIRIGAGVTVLPTCVFYGSDSIKNVVFEDVATWYVTNDKSDMENKVNGTAIDVSKASSNANNFKSTYKEYYWYKL